MSSFVSYSQIDRDLVTPIVAVLRLGDPNAFRDDDSIVPGKEWAKEIEKALMASERVVVMWTVAASESKYVEAEYVEAIRMGKDVVPILLDETKLPEALAPYQWIDFRPFVDSAIKRRLVASAQAMTAQLLSFIPGVGAAVLSPIIAALYTDLLRRRVAVSFSDDEASQLQQLFERRISGYGEELRRGKASAEA
jgi:TIR domain-containing protein